MLYRIILINIILFIKLISYKKAIFIEIEEIIFDTNLNSWNIIGDLEKYYRMKLFDIASKIDIKNEYKKYINTETTYKNILYPEIWQLYILDILSNKEILNLINNYISNNISWLNPEKHILQKAAEIAFTPENEVQVMDINNDFIEFIKRLKKSNKNIKLFLTGNKNPNSIKELKKRYNNIFQLFESKIFLPYEFNALKPSEKFYNNILVNLNLKKNEVLFIESEKVYTYKTKDLNIDSIHYNKLAKDNLEVIQKKILG
jgi:FMN phosphatase YigB (HAD superfamily)